MSAAGWQPDPTGRFGQRWFDGNDWTDSVIGANGQLAHDPFPRELPSSSASPWAPQPPAQPAQQVQSWQPAQPVQQAPAQTWRSPTAPAAPVYAAPASAASTDSGSTTVVSLVTFGVAAALLVLCFFVLDWFGNGGDFRVIRDGFSGARNLEFLDDVMKFYFEWVGYVLAGLVVVIAALVVLVRSPTSHRLLHLLAATLAAIGAVLHAFVIVRFFRTDEFDPHFWAWLGTVAYLVILAGLVLSARRSPA